MSLEAPSESEFKTYKYDAKHKDEAGKEGVFVLEEPQKLKLVVQGYENILSNPKFFVGLGNNALVYDVVVGKSKWCIKNRWETVSVECKSKDYSKFPIGYQKLRNVQDYFEKVKSERRNKVARGFQFLPQNNPFDEATYLNRAQKIVKDAGLGKMIPKVSHVCRLERHDYDRLPDGESYGVDEEVYMLIMEKIQGKSIEDCIMQPGHFQPILSGVNIDQFQEKLEKALHALHEQGLYHNDISVRNILIDENGEPHLIDFGAAQHSTSQNQDMFDDNMKALGNACNWFRKMLTDPAKTREEYRREQGYID